MTRIKRPFSVRFDPYTDSIEVLDNPLKIQQGLETIKDELKILTDALNVLAWFCREEPISWPVPLCFICDRLIVMLCVYVYICCYRSCCFSNAERQPQNLTLVVDSRNLKGKVHPKMKILSSFIHTHMLFQSCMTFRGTWMKIFWRMLVTKEFWFLLTSIVFFVHVMEVSDNQDCLVTNILQNMFFQVPQ